jgi:hypothetical protein
MGIHHPQLTKAIDDRLADPLIYPVSSPSLAKEWLNIRLFRHFVDILGGTQGESLACRLPVHCCREENDLV